MKFFSVDSGFYKFLCRFVDVVVLNFWLVLCCLPVVTAGASITAAYSVALRMAKEEEGYITKDFFTAFRGNFKQGTMLWFLTLICTYLVYLNFEIFRASGEENILPLIIGFLAGAVFFVTLLYAYPLSARYDNTLWGCLKNSQKIATRYFGRTLLILVLVIVELLLIFYNSTTMFFGILIGPACVIYTIAGVSRHIFDRVEKDNPEP
jgi:uncharacterized membrane protein YesL